MTEEQWTIQRIGLDIKFFDNFLHLRQNGVIWSSSDTYRFDYGKIFLMFVDLNVPEYKVVSTDMKVLQTEVTSVVRKPLIEVTDQEARICGFENKEKLLESSNADLDREIQVVTFENSRIQIQ
jgi:hypothetical protein